MGKIKGIPKKAYQKLKSSYKEIKAKILNAELLNSKGAELAIEDITKLLAYLYKNSEALKNNKEPLDKLFVGIVLNKDLDGIENLDVSDESKEVVVNSLTKTDYHNPLPNNLELMQEHITQFGAKATNDLMNVVGALVEQGYE